MRIRTYQVSPEIKNIKNEINTLQTEKEQAITDQQYEFAAELREREVKLEAQLEEQESQVNSQRETENIVVTEDDIRDVISQWTGIPLTRIAAEESQRLLEMESDLKKKIIGQDEAVTAVSKAVRRSSAGLKDPKRPIGTFMFLGPTGVGKTYLAQMLGEFMFGSVDNIVRVDMSEFMEKHTVSRLVGSPPGYVGYDDGGQLTDLVRRKNYCLFLLDEIE